MGRITSTGAGKLLRIPCDELERFLVGSRRRPADGLTPEELALRDFG
jgi:hypothetical protein